MDKRELQFILQEGEGLQIEFKESDKNIDKDIVALANAVGGRIFLGITDQGVIKGIQVTNQLKSQIHDLVRNCDPPIEVKVERFEQILVVQVPESTQKPHKCSSGFYLRKGTNSQKMSQKEIVDFIFDQGKRAFDSLSNPRFLLKDVDKKLVAEFLKKAGIEKKLPLPGVLFNLGVLDEAGHLNNAGVLFFCRNPKRYFLQAYVTCARYLGKEKVHILDRADFEGNLVSQVDESVKFVQRNTRLRYEIKEIQRKEIPEYPLEAIREALTNAVMHRDYYEIGSHVQVDIYEDRLEIGNVGALLKPLTKATLGTIAVRRNPLLAELLHRIKYVEKMGTGFQRMKEACATAKVTLSVEADGYFLIRFTPEAEKTVGKTREKTVEKILPGEGRVGEKEGVKEGVKVGEKEGVKLTKNQKKILKLMKDNQHITFKELSTKVKISEKNIYYNIEKLKKNDLLKRLGPDKGGRWEVRG